MAYELWDGKKVTPIWIAVAITAIFAKVPNPGLSLSGIHRSRTTELIANVDQPIVISKRFDTPWANTDQGALPMLL
jgi:hypothetical protein